MYTLGRNYDADYPLSNIATAKKKMPTCLFGYGWVYQGNPTIVVPVKVETTDTENTKYSHLEPWIEIWDREQEPESASDEAGATACPRSTQSSGWKYYQGNCN